MIEKTNEAAIQLVKEAEVILLPGNSNEEWATEWLRTNNIDVPDFPGRSLHRICKKSGPNL